MQIYGRVYQTQADAIEQLAKAEFKWNQATQRYERGKEYINLKRAYVGQTKDGRWVITNC